MHIYSSPENKVHVAFAHYAALAFLRWFKNGARTVVSAT